jgi:hypothetical protein
MRPAPASIRRELREKTYPVAGHGPLALLDHGLDGLGDFGAGGGYFRDLYVSV